MAAKIDAARRARSHLRIIARTDAVASEGIDAAIRRAGLYLEAGADAIFPEALESEEMFCAFARGIDAPLLANMADFGRTPPFTASQFEAFGFKMVIWPTSALTSCSATSRPTSTSWPPRSKKQRCPSRPGSRPPASWIGMRPSIG